MTNNFEADCSCENNLYDVVNEVGHSNLTCKFEELAQIIEIYRGRPQEEKNIENLSEIFPRGGRGVAPHFTLRCDR